MYFTNLKGIAFKYKFIDFGPEEYFAIMSGTIMLTPDIVESIMAMLSFDTPASMSFKIDTESVAANPILNTYNTY